MPIASLSPGPFIALVCLLITVLCHAARQYHPEPALRLLGMGTFAGAIGLPLVMMRPPVPEWIAIPIGNSIVLLALALFWQATMRLYGRPLFRWGLAAPVLLWLGLCAFGWFRHSLALRVEIAMAMVAGLVFLPLCRLARPPRETRTQLALLVIGGVHVVCSAVRGLLTAMPGLFPWEGLVNAAIPFEMLSYVVLWPGLMLILVAERAMRQARTMAFQDDMTGVLNRRGFWQAAEALPRRGVLLFDIDHFKHINDTFGHAAGDRVIRHFSTVATDALGPDVLFGRIGGEEFAAAVSGLSHEALCAVAERVRLAFAETVTPPGVRATVSIGIAAPATPGLPLGEQMALADRALYRAKHQGRNRTEGDGSDPVHSPASTPVPPREGVTPRAPGWWRRRLYIRGADQDASGDAAFLGCGRDRHPGAGITDHAADFDRVGRAGG